MMLINIDTKLMTGKKTLVLNGTPQGFKVFDNKCKNNHPS